MLQFPTHRCPRVRGKYACSTSSVDRCFVRVLKNSKGEIGGCRIQVLIEPYSNSANSRLAAMVPIDGLYPVERKSVTTQLILSKSSLKSTGFET